MFVCCEVEVSATD